MFLTGCSLYEETMQRFTPEKEPLTSELPRAFYKITLNETTPAEVMSFIQRPKVELMALNENTIASWGQKKDGYQLVVANRASEMKDGIHRAHIVSKQGVLYYPQSKSEIAKDLIEAIGLNYVAHKVRA